MRKILKFFAIGFSIVAIGVTTATGALALSPEATWPMMANMMAGATASDIDVAFMCAMIPHHQGAIAMAEAALKHGDDPFVRALAEQVIAAQNQEITDMLNWLEGQK